MSLEKMDFEYGSFMQDINDDLKVSDLPSCLDMLESNNIMTMFNFELKHPSIRGLRLILNCLYKYETGVDGIAVMHDLAKVLIEIINSNED